MTRYQHRRAHICAAMHALTRLAPATAECGPALRCFESGPLTIVARERGEWLVLEAWLYGEGRVARFRMLPQTDYCETLAWRPAALPRWEAVLDFELVAMTEPA